jgi:hypothetical protein
MLFLLASLPMLAAVLAGSASLSGNARPRTPFVAAAPDGDVVMPGSGPEKPSGGRRPVASVPDERRGFPPRDEDPVRTGSTTRLDSTRSGVSAGQPGTGSGGTVAGGAAGDSGGTPATPKPTMGPSTPGGSPQPSASPDPTPTPTPTASAPTADGATPAPEDSPAGNAGIMGALVSGIGSLLGLG